MKKILLLILIVLVGFLWFNVVANGFNLGNISILGVGGIKEKNDELDKKIDEIQDLRDVQYNQRLNELIASSNTLKTNKKTYEEMVAYSSEQDILKAAQGEMYNAEVLWVRIGNHAEKRKVVPTLDILVSPNNSSNTENKESILTDLKITATGRYSGIADFIRDLEDDPKLEFTIEKFELVPVAGLDGTELQASFMVSNIFIEKQTMTETNTNININNNEDGTNTDTTNQASTDTNEQNNQ